MPTVRFLENTNTRLHCRDGGNLFLKVDASGNKSWIVRWQGSDGKQRKLGLGPFTPSRWRRRATRPPTFAADLAGIDPRQARQEVGKVAAAVAEAQGADVRPVRSEIISAQQAGWKNGKHADQWKATLATYASPVFGSLPWPPSMSAW